MTENTELATRDAELMNTLNDSTKLGIIRNLFAKGLNETEFAVFLELAKRYRLDPFSRQIWAIKYGSEDAKIFVGRDGYLAVAHKSPYFDGMESGTLIDDKGELVGWCRVHRSDMKVPFYVQVYASEYSTKKSLWLSKPRTMIQKVAECQCLRKAFNLSGFYDPDEVGDDGAQAQNSCPSHAPASASAQTSEVPGCSASSRMPTPTTGGGASPAQDMSVCSRCGKPALSGERLEKFKKTFTDNRGTELPMPLCEECATKLWYELGEQQQAPAVNAGDKQRQGNAESEQ